MKHILTHLAALLLAPLAADAAQLEKTRALDREYTAGFIHPATDLAYGHRINALKA